MLEHSTEVNRMPFRFPLVVSNGHAEFSISHSYCCTVIGCFETLKPPPAHSGTKRRSNTRRSISATLVVARKPLPRQPVCRPTNEIRNASNTHLAPRVPRSIRASRWTTINLSSPYRMVTHYQRTRVRSMPLRSRLTWNGTPADRRINDDSMLSTGRQRSIRRSSSPLHPRCSDFVTIDRQPINVSHYEGAMIDH